MPDVLQINGESHTIGFSEENKRQEIYELIDEYMGDEFARYIDEYISDLEEKSNETYWKEHTDEQVYEEELNEIHGFLNELWDYLDEIKSYGSKYKKMPEWGHIAIEAMDKMKEYM